MNFVVVFLVALSGLQVVLSLRPNKWRGLVLPLAGLAGMAVNMIVVAANYQGTSIPRSDALLALLFFLWNTNPWEFAAVYPGALDS